MQKKKKHPIGIEFLKISREIISTMWTKPV